MINRFYVTGETTFIFIWLQKTFTVTFSWETVGMALFDRHVYGSFIFLDFKWIWRDNEIGFTS